MAEGYVMTIPQSVLNKLDQADAKITKIAQNSEQARDKVRSSFQAMANSIDPLLQKLEALKSLGNIKLDNTFKNSATAAEKAADSIAKVATQLNKINDSSTSSSAKTSALAWQGINENLKIQQARLDAVNRSIKEYENTLARINAGKGGVVSQADQTAYNANLQEAQAIQKTIAAYELKQQRIIGLQQALQQQLQYEKELISLAQGSQSLPEQRKNDELRKMNQYYKELEVSSKKQAIESEKAAKAEEKAAISAAKKANAQQTKADNKSALEAAKAEEMYYKALAKTEVTITQRARKIEALTNAQRALNATGRDYSTQLSKIASETQRLQSTNENVVKSTRKLRSEQSKIMDITGQLVRKFALLFSVSAITGYVNKLVQVRGEFELQNKALQSILQNKDQANEIWDKTVQLAVRSPFTVKELVTYTKQLAAYRIEADKLYDTNKMLADVSAGLGVSMDRLILAFGQVKAANYLRASEVRQFTEAGVNMLGELSAIYTELEGKMVSVGDVQERITKRMVTFGDVEEVFKRITSAGGIFYNMQEVQAETLAGMMSNLQDTFDIMFNEIGKANDGVLKGFVSALKSIVESWRGIAQVAVPVISVLVLRWATIKAQTLLAGGALKQFIERSTIGLKMVGAQLQSNAVRARALRMEFTKMGGISFNMWATALSLVAIAAWEVYNAISETRRQQEELNKIAVKGSFDASKSVAEYKRLADIVADTTKTYDEQKEALDTLKRTYGDILPSHLLEVKTIRELQGDYEGATKAIYNYVDAKTKEAQVRFINEEDGQELIKKTNKAAKSLKSFVSIFSGKDVPIEKFNKVLSLLNEEIRQGTVDQDNYTEKLRGLIKEYTSIELPDLKIDLFSEMPFTQKSNIERERDKIADTFYVLVRKAIEVKEKLDGVFNSNTNVGTYIQDRLKGKKDEIDEIVKEAQSALKTLYEYQKGNPIVTEKQANFAKKAINETYAYLGMKAPELNKILNNSMLIHDETININKAGLNKMYDYIKYLKIPKEDYNSYMKELENVQKQSDSFDGSNFQKYVRSMMNSFAKLNNINLDGFNKLLADSEDNNESYLKSLKSMLPQLEEELYLLSNLSMSNVADGMSKEIKEARIKTLKEQTKWINFYIKNNSMPQSTSTGESEADKRLKRQLALLKEIGKAYKDNLKYYNKEEAASKTRGDYKGAAAEAGISSLVSTMEFDPSGLISAIEELAKNASNKVRLLLERAIAEVRGEVDLDVRIENINKVKSELDNLFAGYELSVELGKLGMDKDLISQLFNVDTFSLDDIKKKLSDIYPDKSKLSQEQLTVYEDISKKITQSEKKELDNRLKDYVKYLKTSQNERLRIEMEYQEKVANIPKEFTDTQKTDIKENLKQEKQEKLDKQTWEDFTNSSYYVTLFQDLDAVSSQALNNLLAKLEELRSSLGNLPASDLKAVSDQIIQVQNELQSRNPFKNLGNSIVKYIGYLRQKNDLEKAFTASTNRENELGKEVSLKSKSYQISLKEYNNAVKTYGAESDQAKEAKEKMNVSHKSLQTSKQELKTQKGTTEAIAEQQSEGHNLQKTLGNAAGDFAVGIQGAIGLIDQIGGSGGGFDAAKESTKEILGGIGGMASGVSKMMSGDWVGGAMETLSGLAATLGGIFGIDDKKREEEIQNELKLVGRLETSYKRLERAIDKAYTIDTFNESYANAEQNLKKQNESYRKMIEAERGKKDADDERIQEWMDAIEDNNEKIEDLKNQKLQELGGFGAGIEDAASEFASAWMEAYMETGDGLDALNDKWDEFIKNIVVKQLALRGVSKFLEPIMKQIDAAIGDDSYLSTDELAKIKSEVERLTPGLNNMFKDIMEGFGDMLPQPGSASELTGLQKGIQGVTADQAGVIEGYLNSVRFFVSDISIETKRLVASLLDETIPNPILNELRIQTEQIRSINSFLDSVVMSGHRMGRSGVKVFLD